MTSQHSTQLSFEDVYESFQVDSLVNHLVVPESAKGQPTIGISGQKCYELYLRLAPIGSWARTFAVSLVGQVGTEKKIGWYSTRSALTWKVQVTKSSRPYFLLAASTRRTAEIESSSAPGGLLLTPTTKEEAVDLDKFKARMDKYPNGTTMPNLATQVQQMLPTPTRFDYNSARTPEKWEEDKAKYAAKGINLQNPLKQQARLGMLPTPMAQEVETPCEVTETGRRKSGKDSRSLNVGRMASMGMLPTPTTKNASGGAVQVNANGKRQNKGGTEFSAQLHDLAKSQMLPTPTTQDARIGPNNIGGAKHRAERGSQALTDVALNLLPTPNASDAKGGGSGETEYAKKHATDKLKYTAAAGMLPTPCAQDGKCVSFPPSQEKRSSLIGKLYPTVTARCQNNGTDKERPEGQPSRRSELNHMIAQDLKNGTLPTPSAADGHKTTSANRQKNLNMLAPVGTGSQLSPRFVAEMMGFPHDWTALPFLNGDENQ